MLLDRFNIGFLSRRFWTDEPFFGDDHRRLIEKVPEGCLRCPTQRGEGVGDIFRLEGDAFVCQGSKFKKNALCLADSLGQAIECQFFTPCGEPHAQLIFDQLKMTVMITE